MALGLGETNLARYENGTVQSLPDSVRDKLKELYGLSGDTAETLDWAARENNVGALPAFEAIGLFPPMKSVWGLITSAFAIQDLNEFERAYIHPLAVVASLGKSGPLGGVRGLRELEEILRQSPEKFALGRLSSSLPPVPTTILVPGLLVGTQVELPGHAVDRFPNLRDPAAGLGGGPRSPRYLYSADSVVSARFLFSANSVIVGEFTKLMNLMFEEMAFTTGKVPSALVSLWHASRSVYSLESEIEGGQERDQVAAKKAPKPGNEQRATRSAREILTRPKTSRLAKILKKLAKQQGAPAPRGAKKNKPAKPGD